MRGAAAHSLALHVQEAVRGFLSGSVARLAEALAEDGAPDPQTTATHRIATPQGAIALSINLGDTAIFDQVAAQFT